MEHTVSGSPGRHKAPLLCLGEEVAGVKKLEDDCGVIAHALHCLVDRVHQVRDLLLHVFPSSNTSSL